MANLTHPTRLLAATVATLVVLLAAFVPGAGAQSEAGLDCSPEDPAPGDTLTCEAGGLEDGETYTWEATFEQGAGDDGEVEADQNGEVEFDVEIPQDEDGEFTIMLSGPGIDDDNEEDYTFTGSVAASEDGNGNGEEGNGTTTTTVFDDTTTTTTTEDEDGGELDDNGVDDAETSEVDDTDVAGTAVETGPQVDVVPAGGVATGIGPPDDDARSAVAAAVLLALVAGAVALLALARRRAGGRAA